MMEHKVWETLRHYSMLKKGDTVIVALSGGADSVSLFHFFCRQKNIMGINLLACHFDHGLRGEESTRDAAFVAELCARENVLLIAEKANMLSKTKPKGQSTEEWARKLRYAFFEKVALAYNAKVATAHTLSDNAETVLFRLVRGAGPRGLSGIPPVRGFFIRPLLAVSREEVEAYCATNTLPFVQDSTNFDDVYARNRIRYNVIPELEKVHPGAARMLARTAKDMLEVDAFLSQEAFELLKTAEKGNGYDTKLLAKAPQAVLLQALAAVAGPSADRAALEAIMHMVRESKGKLQLSKDKMIVCRKDGILSIENASNQLLEHPQYEIQISCGKHVFSSKFSIQVDVLPVDIYCNDKKTADKGLNFVADYDKINKIALFRTRRQGDVIRLPRRKVTKTIKKWMNEQGIPPVDRDVLPLLADGNNVLWVWGFGFADGLLPDENTQQILSIKLIGEEGKTREQ